MRSWKRIGIEVLVAGAAGLLAKLLSVGSTLPTSIRTLLSVLLFVVVMAISGFIFSFIVWQFEIDRVRPAIREYLKGHEHILRFYTGARL